MFQELAFQIAKKAHSKQVDKAGKDYILHPMKVASYMDTDTEKAVAYLHDVLEDTNVTEDELRNMFPNKIVDTVIILTHRKDESYFEYISRPLHNKLFCSIEKAKNIKSKLIQLHRTYYTLLRLRYSKLFKLRLSKSVTLDS